MNADFDESTMFFECGSCKATVPIKVVGSYSYTEERFAGVLLSIEKLTTVIVEKLTTSSKRYYVIGLS